MRRVTRPLSATRTRSVMGFSLRLRRGREVGVQALALEGAVGERDQAVAVGWGDEGQLAGALAILGLPRDAAVAQDRLLARHEQQLEGELLADLRATLEPDDEQAAAGDVGGHAGEQVVGVSILLKRTRARCSARTASRRWSSCQPP